MKFVTILLSALMLLGCTKDNHSLKENSIIHDNAVRTFYTFIPTNLVEEMTLVIGLHGYTGNARSFIRRGDADFNKFLEENNFIGVYPEGKSFTENGRFFSSWNDLTASKGFGEKGDICDIDRDYYPYPPDCINPHRCSWASCGDDIGFIEKVIDKVKTEFNIKSVIVIGISNGGMMAQAVGCKLGEKIDAVINVSGMQSLGMSCIPKTPTSMVIYGAVNDTIVPPIDIIANDGYFYEPMENTVLEWKNELNCNQFRSTEITSPANISIEHYFDCDENKTITSILDHENGHDWPKPYKWGLNILFRELVN